MADKYLVVVVDGTAAMGPYWNAIRTDYLEKIVRYVCAKESSEQGHSDAAVDLGLVTYNSHGPYSAFIVQSSGWTRNVDAFLQRLSCLSFGGGGFNDAAVAEGLADALVMFPKHVLGCQTDQDRPHVQKHCILVGASNPFLLPKPVHLPKVQSSESGVSSQVKTEICLADAETVAKLFTPLHVSLSVISPKQLPKLREIYEVGNSNPQAADHTHVNNPKYPHFLVLLAGNFKEARAVLVEHEARSKPSFQTPVTTQTDLEPPKSETIMPNAFYLEDELMTVQELMIEFKRSQPKTPSDNNIPAAIKEAMSIENSMEFGSTLLGLPQNPYGTSKSELPSTQASFHFSTRSDDNRTDDTREDVRRRGNDLSPNTHPENVASTNASLLSSLTQKYLKKSTAQTDTNPAGLHQSSSEGKITSSQVTSGQEALAGHSKSAQHTSGSLITSATSILSEKYKTLQLPKNLQGSTNIGQSQTSMTQGSIGGSQTELKNAPTH